MLQTLLGCLLAVVTLSAADPTPQLQARKVMDEFMTAFNARDPVAWAATRW